MGEVGDNVMAACSNTLTPLTLVLMGKSGGLATQSEGESKSQNASKIYCAWSTSVATSVFFLFLSGYNDSGCYFCGSVVRELQRAEDAPLEVYLHTVSLSGCAWFTVKCLKCITDWSLCLHDELIGSLTPYPHTCFML